MDRSVVSMEVWRPGLLPAAPLSIHVLVLQFRALQCDLMPWVAPAAGRDSIGWHPEGSYITLEGLICSDTQGPTWIVWGSGRNINHILRLKYWCHFTQWHTIVVWHSGLMRPQRVGADIKLHDISFVLKYCWCSIGWHWCGSGVSDYSNLKGFSWQNFNQGCE